MKRINLLLLTLVLYSYAAYAACDITHTDAEVCIGESTTLTCQTTDADTYEWSTGATTSSITVSPTASITYTCKATKKGGSSTDNLINAGDFEFAPNAKITSEVNALGDVISYEYENWDETGKNIGFGCTTSATDANNVKPLYFAHCAPQHGSWLLVCDGGASASTKVWSARNLKLKKGVTYEFSCYASNIDLEYTAHGQASLAKIKFGIESDEGSKDLTNWEYVGNLAGGDLGQWKQIKATYTPSKDISWAHISIYNSCVRPDGNDFAIDNIYFGVTRTTEDVVTNECFPVVVQKLPKVSLSDDVVDCPDTPVTLTATASEYSVIQWYDNSGAEIAGATGLTLSVKTPSQVGVTEKYKVKVTGKGACSSANAVDTENLTSKNCSEDIEWSTDVCGNGATSITAKTTGSNVQSYKWDGTTDGATLNLTSVTDGEQHKCLVTYTNGSTITETVTINVHPVESTELTDSVTEGESYDKNGFTFTSEETAKVGELVKQRMEKTKCCGCDSIITLTLTVKAKPEPEPEPEPEPKPDPKPEPVTGIVPMVYFTPNGDGLNDKWLVKNIEQHPTAIISIYDRYNKLLFTFKGSEFKGWDGNYNGHPMQETDYWYVITGEDLDKTYSGHFILKR